MYTNYKKYYKYYYYLKVFIINIIYKNNTSKDNFFKEKQKIINK